MPLLPGAEPFRHDGGELGVLVCHGFTGSPQSVRPWAQHLADRGHTVSVPLLPGHGTRWQELAVTGWPDWYATVRRELRDLARRCPRVFVCGLSMGGSLALRLAIEHGTTVSGLVLVNPLHRLPGLGARILPVARHLLASSAGVANDIAKPGAREWGYDRMPLHAAHSLRGALRRLDGGLCRVSQPLLVMHSPRDHVVPPADSARILARVSSRDVTECLLERSYHVATLDHDAERVCASTDAFIDRLTAPASHPTGLPASASGATEGTAAHGGL